MCGIAGGVWKTQKLSLNKMGKALQKLKHRGPNDQGLEIMNIGSLELALGQTRLSIIDLSNDGHQPMYSRDKRWVIVFNGEIYNYKELKVELLNNGFEFSTNTDTEVLLAAWICWGVACLPRLCGMFAFAVYDNLNDVLICARDAFGIKPIYYTGAQNSFRFSSEIPALIEICDEKPSLNWQKSVDYLLNGAYDDSVETFFYEIKQLSAGHFLEINIRSDDIPVPVRWWKPTISLKDGWTYNDAKYQILESFLSNIKLHLRSDVPLGAALSGGIDSSAVVCAIRHIQPHAPIHTFSFVTPGSPADEEKWIDLINQHVGAIAHKIEVSSDQLLEDLDDMIGVQGEPFGSTSIYAQYRVFKTAKESGMTVILDGQGADEMLAGYLGYPGQRIRSIIETKGYISALKFINSWAKWPGRSIPFGLKAYLSQIIPHSIKSKIKNRKLFGRAPKWVNFHELIENKVSIAYERSAPDITEKGRRVVAELSQCLSVQGLGSLLRHADRNSMRFSIESRVPFLTIDFVNLALSLPEDYLISDCGETKSIFRQAMNGLVPDSVLNRKDKIGFETPEKNWILSIKDSAREWLSYDLNIPFLNQAELLKEFDLIVQGKKEYTWQVWRWINFCRWYRKFFLDSQL